MPPDPPPGPDQLDRDLSASRDAVDNINVWVAIWQARREPDAHARRCAGDAVRSLDELVAAAYRVRAWLITELGQADRDAAARADELLARTAAPPGTRDGLRSCRPKAANRSTSTAAPGAEAMPVQGTPGPRHGGEPCEAAP